MDKHKKDLKVLEAAHHAWVALASARERRRRYLRYTYGDQWSDVTRDRFGNLTTAGDKQSDSPDGEGRGGTLPHGQQCGACR